MKVVTVKVLLESKEKNACDVFTFNTVEEAKDWMYDEIQNLAYEYNAKVFQHSETEMGVVSQTAKYTLTIEEHDTTETKHIIEKSDEEKVLDWCQDEYNDCFDPLYNLVTLMHDKLGDESCEKIFHIIKEGMCDEGLIND